MIRLADRSDLNRVADLVCEFLETTSYGHHTDNLVNEEHIRHLVFSVLHLGYIWLLEVDGEVVGMLAAIKEPNIWIPQKRSLRELVWYIRPEHRSSVGGGKLFIRFCQKGDELIKSGEIQGYFTTRMTTTADYDLESRGFRLTEKLYLKDQ